MRRTINERAPDYLRESNLSIREKYLLWEAVGSEDAKREVAKLLFIPNATGTDGDNEAAVREAVFEPED